MVVFYIVRDVAPGSRCSYPAGRTLLNATGGVFTNEADALARADTYNRHCHTAGVRYSAVPHDEHQPFPADRYEQP